MADVPRHDESALRDDAFAVAEAWRRELDLEALVGAQLADLVDCDGGIDVVAVGKAAPEMARAASAALASSVRRRFIASHGPTSPGTGDVVVVGEHPVPGAGSAEAGRQLLEFLDGSDAGLTLFLVSGGASSICVAPVAPLGLSDLETLWRRALALGWDVTRLNRARAATSALGGGAVLRRVRTARTRSLVMVDNVVDGAPWVASALTYDYRPSRRVRRRLVADLDPLDANVRARLAAALSARVALTGEPVRTAYENRVVVDPFAALSAVLSEARRRGHATVSLGAVTGEVGEVVEHWAGELRGAPDGPVCVAGVGEVTIRVTGAGLGGRCQEFALRVSEVLASLGRPGVCVALATDGRDYLEGVGGAWVDESTARRVAPRGADVRTVVARHDAHRALASLGQLVVGSHTGWNLCDVYVVVLGPAQGPRADIPA